MNKNSKLTIKKLELSNLNMEREDLLEKIKSIKKYIEEKKDDILNLKDIIEENECKIDVIDYKIRIIRKEVYNG